MVDVEVHLPRARSYARQRHGHVTARVVLDEVARVHHREERVVVPVVQPKQGSDAHGVHAGPRRALGRVQAPAVVVLRANGVQVGVDVLVVRLLEHREPVNAGAPHHAVLVLGERVHLHADGVDGLLEDARRLGDVGGRRGAAALAREDDDVVEALGRYGLALARDLVWAKDGTRHLVVLVEPAVHAAVVAHVGEVEGREQRDGAAKVAFRERVGLPRRGLELLRRGRGGGDERQEVKRALGARGTGARDVCRRAAREKAVEVEALPLPVDVVEARGRRG